MFIDMRADMRIDMCMDMLADMRSAWSDGTDSKALGPIRSFWSTRTSMPAQYACRRVAHRPSAQVATVHFFPKCVRRVIIGGYPTTLFLPQKCRECADGESRGGAPI